MNFSVTGEPAPSQLDQKRKQLLQGLLGAGPGAGRILAGRGGFTRGFTASDSPNGAIPSLSFNPFLAQLQRGVGGLNQPTAGVRDNINAPGRGLPAANGMIGSDNAPMTPGDAQAPGLGGAPGFAGGPSAPTLGAPNGPMQPDLSQSGNLDQWYQPTQGIFRNLLGVGDAPQPAPTPLPYLGRPSRGGLYMN